MRREKALVTVINLWDDLGVVGCLNAERDSIVRGFSHLLRDIAKRWKQVSSANSDLLSRFKIKEIWHLVTYDEDLSDEKLTALGAQRHIFYLRDESCRLEHAIHHKRMSHYVRPMSQFITDIRQEQGLEFHPKSAQ